MVKWILIVSLFTGEEKVILRDMTSIFDCNKVGQHFIAVNYGLYSSYKCKPVIERKQNGS